VQCVDCVAQAAAATRSPTTIFGGTLRQGRPVVTIGIIAACAVAYVLQQVVPGFTQRWWFAPVMGEGEWLRMLTSAFLHGSITHIALNMITLWFVGPMLEQALGRVRYLVLYLVCAFGGSVGVVLLAGPTHSWNTAVVGASGAIFGLFGAVLMVLRRVGNQLRSIVTLIVLNLVLGFVVGGIAWQAHIGGLATGLVLSAAYAFVPRAWQKVAAWVAPTAVVVMLVLLTHLAYQAAPAFVR
jgi:membrane associated rhomboid family serine protease